MSSRKVPDIFPPILTEGKQEDTDEAKQTTKTKQYN